MRGLVAYLGSLEGVVSSLEAMKQKHQFFCKNVCDCPYLSCCLTAPHMHIVCQVQPRSPQVGTVTYKTTDRNRRRGCKLHASQARVNAPKFGRASEPA